MNNNTKKRRRNFKEVIVGMIGSRRKRSGSFTATGLALKALLAPHFHRCPGSGDRCSCPSVR